LAENRLFNHQFWSVIKTKPMAYQRNVKRSHPAGTRISARYRQFVALIAVIVIGMIISSAVNAIPSAKSRAAATKAAAPVMHSQIK
jgi:hypothetical protein